MLNEIIKGVSTVLGDTFQDHYIYQNDVQQGLDPPCFFIGVLKPALEPLTWCRYLSINPLDVRYFPTDSSKNAEMFNVASELMEILEFITLPNGDIVRGTKMNCEVVDGVLHFYVNYDVPVRRQINKTPMETLKTYVGP